MKQIVYFWTHCGLDLRHAKLSINSLKQQTQPLLWDEIYIYNTHADELSNDLLIKLLDGLSNKIEVVPYDDSSIKILSKDVINVLGHMKTVCANEDRVLWLKSDFAISNTFNETIKTITDTSFLWSLPGAGAKECVTDDEIMRYLEKGAFQMIDDITYYRGSETFEPMAEMGPKDEDGTIILDTDPRIKFVSGNFKTDFSCHFANADSFFKIRIADETFPSINPAMCALPGLGVKFLDVQGAFGIHIHHETITRNNKTDRTFDKRKMIPGQRY